jgi:hypothetical protein
MKIADMHASHLNPLPGGERKQSDNLLPWEERDRLRGLG